MSGIDRGAQSLEVLRFVKSLAERALTVQGNHDLHLAMVAEGHGKRHKEDTLDAILTAPDRDELLAWLWAQPLLHVEGEYVVVHAGLLPQWSVAQVRDLAEEVSRALTAPEYREFLAHMYGSEPAAWDDRFASWDRLRVIVNAPVLLPSALLRTVLKYAGFSLGMIESALPLPVKRHISMHRRYWDGAGA